MSFYSYDNLKVDEGDLSTQISGSRRLERLNTAISWPSGTSLEDQVFQTLWENENMQYAVKLGKPGKEFFENTIRYKDGLRKNNPNDMRPTLFNKNEQVNKYSTFEEIFHSLQLLWKDDARSAELMACLLFRSAYMLDHKKINSDNGLLWVYKPPLDIVKLISRAVESIQGVPSIVFLHYLDAVGLNEDVKYHTLGYPIQQGYGRRNNLLTYVNVLAMFLEKVPFGVVAGSFARPPAGVAPISKKKAGEVFTYLGMA